MTVDPLKTINYSGIFLSCYSEEGMRCTHMVRDHSLSYIFSGEMAVTDADGQETVIKKGECVFIRRDHRADLTKRAADGEPFRAIFITFKRSFLRDFYNRIEKKEVPADAVRHDLTLVRIKERPDITSLFQSLTPYFDSNVRPSDEIVDLKEQEGVYALLRTDKSFYPVLFDFTEPWKIDIMEFLAENYMYDLTIEEIAAFTGRSLATFKRDFRKISDLPPQKWLIQKRLEAAYDLLRRENRKASDIYVEVGFKNLSHFYSAFKRQYGFSPKK